ncbi:MAG: transposase [Anaerolineae bacterium]
MKIREYLSASGLFRLVQTGFEKIKDFRADNQKIALVDALMSAFAMFSLKDSSLLAFDERRAKDKNLKCLYGIKTIPCDTQMRTILDEVDPEDMRPLYKDVFRQLQRGKVMEKMVFIEDSYQLTLDGTGYFASKAVHCPSCLEKKSSKTGEIRYAHQLLGGAIVHPDYAEVVPFAPEAIIKQDGKTKNDCERNAAKRFLEKLRQDHPHLSLIVIEDGLSSNAPHISELRKYGLHYILGVKEGDHKFLFEYVAKAHQAGQTTKFECESAGVVHRFRFINQAPLNEANSDLLVNFVEYWEVKPGKTQHFSWVTDFIVTTANVFQIMRGGRARWKVENETFNTLKNQGYHFEHNFGHGNKNLSVVFASLMMLAFLVDQAQQLACELFQAVLEKERSRIRLWEHVRALFYTLEFACMEDIFRALLYGFRTQVLILEPP